jgi:hypothetical protein
VNSKPSQGRLSFLCKQTYNTFTALVWGTLLLNNLTFTNLCILKMCSTDSCRRLFCRVTEEGGNSPHFTDEKCNWPHRDLKEVVLHEDSLSHYKVSQV